MSLAKVPLWTAVSTLVEIGVGLLVGKLLAVSFGPAGFGLATNLHQLITIFDVFAGAGISNGVTRYVAQYHDNPQQLHHVVGTSLTMVLGFSALMTLASMLAAVLVSQGLFDNTDYQGLACSVVLMQIGIAWSNLLLALMKGFRDTADDALFLIVGSLIGVLAYYVSHCLGGYRGVLLSLALIPTSVVIPVAIMLIKRGIIPLSYLKPSRDNSLAGQLSKFTLMALITSVTLPVAYIMVRKLLVVQYNWDGVGVWQGVSSISDAYLQFITASFSVYLLPTLSRLAEKRDITRKVVKSLKSVLPAVAAASFTVWLLRGFTIWLLLLNKLIAMRDLFAWQLVGDVLKVGAYALGYLVIAKASLWFYILTEISQFTLLMVFAHWLIFAHGALGTAQAYTAICIVYFSLCYGMFLLWCRQV